MTLIQEPPIAPGRVTRRSGVPRPHAHAADQELDVQPFPLIVHGARAAHNVRRRALPRRYPAAIGGGGIT
jgi:hypothetical protein